MELTTYNYKFNQLDDSHPKSDNIPGLSIELMNHQKTAIYHAEILESNNGFRIPWIETPFWNSYCRDEEGENYRDVYTNFGVLACKVGSGKSFVALALILKNHLLNYDRMVSSESNSVCFTFKRVSTVRLTVPTNMILVPHNLFNQWKEYIQTRTNLSTFFVGTKKDLSKIIDKMTLYKDLNKITDLDDDQKMIRDDIFNELTNNRVYLVSSTSWNNFVDLWKQCINKKVSRVFIDEVHSIYLPSSSRIRANFIWFITSSLIDLREHRNIGFIRDTIYSYENIRSEYTPYVVIKNNDDYIDSSLKLPVPITRVYRSKASIILNIFAGIINQDVKNMLLAEDINGVIGYLGIETVSESNIISVLCSNMEKELDNAKLMHQAKLMYHYPNENAKNEAIAKSNNKIISIQEKINNVRARISENNMDPIMHMDISNPVVTICCKNKFDLESITAYYDYQSKKYGNQVNCPLCRVHLDITKLIFIGEKKQVKVEVKEETTEWKYEDHTKIENLEHLLATEIPLDKKILIFSEFEGNFESISTAFSNAGRTNLTPLKGAMSHISTIIDKFNKGEIPNLFLNAKYCGSGLNLQKADIIIIMHEMTKDNIKQIIGRGNRIGRTSALEVIFLLSDKENQ